MRVFLVFFLGAFFLQSEAQKCLLKGNVMGNDTAVKGAKIAISKLGLLTTSNNRGQFSLPEIPYGNYEVWIQVEDYKTKRIRVWLKEPVYNLPISLQSLEQNLNEIIVTGSRDNATISRMKEVEGTIITAGKKTEVIKLENISANTSLNSSRQIFAQVPGINTIENDAGGIQLSIATRGLNPNRITEFNARQNGYDISADALGYPESYYTPPVDALDRIEIIRGAAALQYGSQFGGLLNFIYKKGNRNKIIDADGKLTVAQYGTFAAHINAGGQYKGLNYFASYNHRNGNSWRENASYNINTAFVSVELAAKKYYTGSLEYTFMQYTAQQPGGLTDKQFAENARQSNRNRNWFNAQWNMVAQKNEFAISSKLKISWVNFFHYSHRYSVGTLTPPNLPDNIQARDLQKDNYLNFGSEARLLYTYNLFKKQQNLVVGVRFYRGETKRQQGLGSIGKDADFNFLNPENVEGSSYKFPSYNVAVYAEHIFQITQKFSITPGVRIEYMKTTADGFYKANGLAVQENKSNQRVFPLLGIGLSYKAHTVAEVYGNFSQNYSPINYNDIRVVNPNFRVDEKLKDVKGFNADLGVRGKWNFLSYDVSFYFLKYNNRIGVINKFDGQFNIYQYRTNIGSSATYGAEFFAEIDVLKAAKSNRFGHLTIFETFSYTHARYTKTTNIALQNKQVEYAPAWIVRPGIRYAYKGFDVGLNFSFTTQQFTDAINSQKSADGITGIIPAYKIMDARISYTYKWVGITVGCDNLLNEKYFTRRATGYPGPSILPAEARSVYVSLKVGSHFLK